MYWRLSCQPVGRLFCFVGQDRLLRRFPSFQRQAQSLAARLDGEVVLVGSTATRKYPGSTHLTSLGVHGRRAQHGQHAPVHLSTCVLWPRPLRRHICRIASQLVSDLGPHSLRAVEDPGSKVQKQLTMDYTALVASIRELTSHWIPAKIEQVSKAGLTLRQHSKHMIKPASCSDFHQFAVCAKRQTDPLPQTENPGWVSLAVPMLASCVRPHLHWPLSRQRRCC